MADVKISELTALASANVDASGDVLAVVDTSATATRKITVENLLAPITINKASNVITSLGTVSAATSITSSAFVGPLTGNVTGNVSGTAPAGTLTGATLASGVTASSLATVGALSSGSIASGFGTINNGANTITTTGTVSTGALTVGGNIDFNSGTIDLSTQTVDVTLNAAVDALNFDSNTLSIDASNNRVGIGTASPATKLHLSGAVGATSIIKMTVSDGTAWEFGERATAGHFTFRELDGNKDVLTMKSTGDVGIGTASPEDLLHIKGVTSSVSDTQLVLEGKWSGYGAGINFVSRTSSGGTNVSMAKITADGEAAFDTTAANQDAGLRFFTTLNGTSAEKMRIDSAGTLQVKPRGGDIGVADISARTVVLGGRPSSADFVSLGFDAGGTYRGNWDFQASTGEMKWWAYDGSWGEKLKLERNGKTTFSGSIIVYQKSLYVDAVQDDTVFSGSTGDNTSCNLIGSDGYWGIRTASNNSFNIDVYNGGSPKTALTALTGGNVGIGADAPACPLHVLALGNDGAGLVRAQSSSTSGNPEGIFVYYPLDSSTSGWAFYNANSAEGKSMITNAGGYESRTNSYGGWSDERIKTNIVDANSQWDDIKNIRLRNFKYKSTVAEHGDDAPTFLGVVAQEVESISPSLVGEIIPSKYEIEECGFGEQNEDGEWVVKKDENGKDMAVKTMKYSILYMKAIKALQESMAKIETLETKVEALENA